MGALKRLATFLFVMSACVLYAKSDGTGTLDHIYAESDSHQVTDDSLKCEGIEGRVGDCSECFTCDHEAVARHRELKHRITELKLNDANCASSETICCVSQKDLKFRDSDNLDRLSCGNTNPEGYPRALRASIRSVLQGEYPWRAWIYYLQKPNEPLCAATYVNKESRILLTAASCIQGRRDNALRVRFSRDPSSEAVTVKRIDIHENYDKETHENDIAVLSVEWMPKWTQRACLPIEPALLGTACVAVSTNDYYVLSVGSVLEWTQRACLPIEPALLGTACVAVSTNDYYLNQVIPRQSKCMENGTLHDSLMCTATHKDDFKPEFGGGVYCVDEQSTLNTYSVVGVHLTSAENGLAALHTNVSHFVDWLNNKFEMHRNI